MAYSADSGPCDALLELARGVDLFVCEAGSPGEQEMAMHLNGRQAGEVAARAGAQRLLVTHLAPGTDANDTLAHARSSFGGPVGLAAEGLSDRALAAVRRAAHVLEAAVDGDVSRRSTAGLGDVSANRHGTSVHAYGAPRMYSTPLATAT